MARLAERLLVALALVVLLLVCLHGRVPPLVMRGSDAELPTFRGSVSVEVPVAPGRFLRGRFRPACPGAPVVLRLPEADAHGLTLRGGFFGATSTLADRLEDLGFACLELDYTGIGGSDGRPSPANLASDARAMWDEAVRRAGGDPGRVVLHATSLGTLAASELLVGGARPAGAMLVAPVMRDTAVARAAGVVGGPALERLASWLAAPLFELDLRDACEAGLPPTLVLAGARDRFTSPDERRELAGRVRAAGGTWIECDLDHDYLTRKGQALQGEGVAFLSSLGLGEPPSEPRLSEVLACVPEDVVERFRSDPNAYERLCQAAARDHHSMPLVVAASAWPELDPDTALRLRWLWPSGGILDRDFVRFRDFDFDALAALMDVNDPAGDLPVEALELRDVATGWVLRSPVDLERIAALPGAGILAGYGHGPFELEFDSRKLWERFQSEGHELEVQRRRFARTLLKLHELPDRLRPGPDGEPVLEVLDGFTWRPFDFDPAGVDPGDP